MVRGNRPGFAGAGNRRSLTARVASLHRARSAGRAGRMRPGPARE